MAPMQPKKPMAIDKEPTPIRMYEATFTVSDDSSAEKTQKKREFILSRAKRAFKYYSFVIVCSSVHLRDTTNYYKKVKLFKMEQTLNCYVHHLLVLHVSQ